MKYSEPMCGVKMAVSGLVCFLPPNHKFVNHCARDGEMIYRWGEPAQKYHKHDCKTHPQDCKILGHTS